MRFGLLLAASMLAYAAPFYQVTDLGSLGAGSILSVNNGGQVAGYSSTSLGRQAYSPSIPLSPYGSENVASQINNFGEVVGTAYIGGRPVAGVWKNGVFSPLHAAGDSFGMGINNYGEFTGGMTDSLGNMTAYFSSGGVIQMLAGGVWSAGYSVNTSGQVAGVSQIASGAFHAVMWSASGAMTDLGTLGGLSSYASAINEAGVVVGHSLTPGGYSHAFLYTGSQMTDLGTLGGNASYATGINSSGAITGYSYDVSNAESRAFLYQNGQLTDLNTRIALNEGWRLVTATAINATGQIAGMGTHYGEMRAYLLSPIAATLSDEAAATPEPAALALTGTGLLTLAFLKRFANRGSLSQWLGRKYHRNTSTPFTRPCPKNPE